MRYIPHTPEDIRKMLGAIGVQGIADLFESIPPSLRLNRPLCLPAPLSEPELLAHIEALAAMNTAGDCDSFLGGGAYRHHVPAAVDMLLRRGELFTAYTPYQPEVSQGTLQAIFEYQTMTARLLGMEVANASMYDGASAAAEAVLMACRVTRRKNVFYSTALNPAYIEVIRTYIRFQAIELTPLPVRADGRTNLEFLKTEKLNEAAAVLVQSPDFFGVIEDLAAVKSAIGSSGALFAVTFTEPLAYALVKSPGECGADIAAGEGASFGMPVSFGGPYLGIFASLKKYVRSMPGRLAGETVDADGRRAFVLTLSTREQHIRREKATSNICTNQALCALACTIYLSLQGKNGLRELAQANLDLCEYAKTRLAERGLHARFSGPTFNEFVVDLPVEADRAVKAGLEKKLLPGLSLRGKLQGGEKSLLVSVTELNTRECIDRLQEFLGNL